MPILNIHRDRTVEELCHNFHCETGLRLLLYHHHRPANYNQMIKEIFDYKRNKLCYRRKSINEGLMVFGRLFSPAAFKFRMMHEYFLNCDVLDKNSHIISGSKDYTIDRDILPLDLDKLYELNRRLTLLEKEIIRETRKLEKYVNGYYKKSRWLKDINFSCKITHFLGGEDPVLGRKLDYESVAEQSVYVSYDNYDLIGSSDDWNEARSIIPFRCCYLFHDLYDHRNLEFCDMQRIKTFWLEYNVDFQHFYEIRKPGGKGLCPF